MSEDRFFERVRGDARSLRYEAGDVASARLAARIRARIEQPTVWQFLAAWFRPLAASLSALAIVATIALFRNNEALSLSGDAVEISVAGDVYSVAD
jgi:hypothetical protein